MQPLDGSFHGELRAGLGNVFHGAIAPPGPVDAHHMRTDAAFEYDALALAPFCHHRLPSLSKQPARALRCPFWRRLTGGWLTTGKTTGPAGGRGPNTRPGRAGAGGEPATGGDRSRFGADGGDIASCRRGG